MKRLLLAPLLIALTGCSNDLRVKTVLGEKYIVKDETVIVKPYRKADAIKTIEEKTIDDMYKDGFIKALENSKLDLIGYKIHFRDIFINLNNIKIAGEYKTVNCFNYSGTRDSRPTEEEKAEFIEPLRKEDSEKKFLFWALMFTGMEDNDVDTELARAICDKYAKF